MIFSVSAIAPINFSSRSFARIAMVVIMQDARAVPMRSVGENLAPLPWLSVGASVSMVDLDCKWVAKVLSSPEYYTVEVMLFFINLHNIVII